VVKIFWYEGGKSEETPRRIVIDGQLYDVEEVLERALVFDARRGKYQRKIRIRCRKSLFDWTKAQNGDRKTRSVYGCYGTFCLIEESNKWRCKKEK